MNKYAKYCLLSSAAVAAASVYPLYMGARVLAEMARRGAVPLEEYPKYVIPYTPIALAAVIGVVLMPLLQRLSHKRDMLYGTLVSAAVFFIAERLMETRVLVQTQKLIPLESWQMSLCYIAPGEYQTRTWEAVDVLLGGYSPAFKLHFYMISVAIVASLMNCFYGYAKMLRTGDQCRRKALAVQAVTGAGFLGMCIWACFTAFYRTGELTVSPLSAVLMAVFFTLLGVTAGVFVASFTMGKRKLLSELAPAASAVLITVFMYVGEMILLSGNLYRFGQGFLFDGLAETAPAPVDILVVIASGGVTLLMCRLLNRKAAGEKLSADGRSGDR